MDGFLRQSTASQVRTVGPFCDSTDFSSLENALTIANTDIKIKKNGAASGNKNSGGATADGSGGLYHLTWDATDTATVGQLSYSIKVAGALVVFGHYWILEEAIFDALFAASANAFNSTGQVNPTGNVKKGAAFSKFAFLMTDSTNHNPATGKTVTVTISKDGGAFGSLSSGDTVTEVASGIYEVDLNATDTNANVIVLRATATGADDTFERIITTI